jgi:hypothetical protein
VTVAAEMEAEIEALRSEIEAGVDAVLAIAERLAESPTTEAKAMAGDLFQACAFQDLAGQRLAKLARLASGAPAATDPLLNGPGLGKPLEAWEVEALLAGEEPRP